MSNIHVGTIPVIHPIPVHTEPTISKRTVEGSSSDKGERQYLCHGISEDEAEMRSLLEAAEM